MELSIVPDTNSDVWDEIITSSTYSTPFHTWKWLKLMEEYSDINLFGRQYKSTLYPVEINEGSETVGIIPLYYYKTPFKRIVASPPIGVQCIYLGPILCNWDTLLPRQRYSKFLDFQKELDMFIKEELKGNTIQINTSPGMEDSRPFAWSGYVVEPRYTNKLDLRYGEQVLFNNLERSVKKNIRKCEREGIEVTEGTKVDIEKIFNLLKSAERISIPIDFLMDVYDSFHPENLRIFIVTHEDDVISGNIIIKYKNRVYSWVGSPKVLLDGLKPNELLRWKTIQWALMQGSELFEIMGASSPALFTFKNKFNSEIELYFRMKWNSPFYRFIEGWYNFVRARS